MLKIFILFVFFLLFIFAVKTKIFLNRQRQKDLPEITNSPVSQALTQLLGVAGGIYLSLVMLAAFLGIEVPEKVFFINLVIDPLALFSLVITLLQPLFIKALQKFY
ncbi:MAG: hypothetical protein PWQ67_1721 [Clostridia bacterium]|nr:hypothetical protein [Clostridia bacterium]MDN5323267.1 hypothetical protein [Clostridia bacterium]